MVRTLARPRETLPHCPALQSIATVWSVFTKTAPHSPQEGHLVPKSSSLSAVFPQGRGLCRWVPALATSDKVQAECPSLNSSGPVSAPLTEQEGRRGGKGQVTAVDPVGAAGHHISDLSPSLVWARSQLVLANMRRGRRTCPQGQICSNRQLFEAIWAKRRRRGRLQMPGRSGTQK